MATATCHSLETNDGATFELWLKEIKFIGRSPTFHNIKHNENNNFDLDYRRDGITAVNGDSQRKS